MLYKPAANRRLRAFAQSLRALREPAHFAVQFRRLAPLIVLARGTLAAVESRHALACEQRDGVLYLFGNDGVRKRAEQALELVSEARAAPRLLSADEVRSLEPAVQARAFAGGVLMPNACTGNCPLFVKQLKQILVEQGVRFTLGRAVTLLRPDHAGASVTLAARRTTREHETRLDADAVVVAAGVGSPALLGSLCPGAALHPARLHTLTAPLAAAEPMLQRAVVDVGQRIEIARFTDRLRIAGAPLLRPARRLAQNDARLRDQAFALLSEAHNDWVPGCARLSAAHGWDGMKLLSPDGLPVVGATAHPRIFAIFGHGPSGWALACGSATVLAEQLSNRNAPLEADCLAALSPARFVSLVA